MFNMSNSQQWIDRWVLSLSNFDFTLTYRLGIEHQDPHALGRFKDEHRGGVEVKKGISTFEAHALVFTGIIGESNRGNKED